MNRFYVRRPPASKETWGAAAAAIGVGVAAFYVVRGLLARDGLDREVPVRAVKTDAETAPLADPKG